MQLFSSRVSHPARAIILFTKINNLAVEEVNVNLLKGEHLKNPNLPFKKVPVLKDGDLTLAESTSILRYISSKHKDQLQGTQWYLSNPKRSAKIDEYLDYWQSTFNPNVMGLVHHKIFYKTMLNLKEPDLKMIQKFEDNFNKAHLNFKKYFIGDSNFIVDNEISIADLVSVVSYEQRSAMIGPEFVDKDPQIQNYLERVIQKIGKNLYDEISTDVHKFGAKARAMIQK